MVLIRIAVDKSPAAINRLISPSTDDSSSVSFNVQLTRKLLTPDNNSVFNLLKTLELLSISMESGPASMQDFHIAISTVSIVCLSVTIGSRISRASFNIWYLKV